MDPMHLTLGLSFALDHAEIYGYLLLALPALSFLSIKIWFISRDDAKAERTTQWYLPPSVESDAMKIVFNHSRRSVVFVHEARPDATRPSAAGTTVHGGGPGAHR